jgi:uncharacterized protein DUF3606
MSKRKAASDDDITTEYDFSGGIRGKHAKEYQRGHTVNVRKNDGTASVQHYTLADGAVLLAPDVRKYFGDSDSVNDALRSLIKLIPPKHRPAKEKAALSSRDQIDLNEDCELQSWSKHFGVSKEKIKDAVKKVGPRLKDVEKLIKLKK